ncbi:MAG: hypothetical protein A2Y17_11845 [Clostridiales bacterium GWF2_38_85]|nr:MAG: hypothetical protein A2Y17_11845 [Clostridiales bacterium GWF2_38_85]
MRVANGVYRCTFGKPEALTAEKFIKAEAKLDKINKLSDLPSPFGVNAEKIEYEQNKEGTILTLPMLDTENIYGFGLQMKSVIHTARKKFLRTNADPKSDAGDSHAPVPFYVSTFDDKTAYGLLIETARYTTFYCGSSKKLNKGKTEVEASGFEQESATETFYIGQKKKNMQMVISIEKVEGCDIILFTGETPDEVCRKYILYSGGGCMPPLYGMGVWYRMDMYFKQEEILKSAKKMKEDNMPVSIIGLEPGWQTMAYSCSFKFNTDRYPDPDRMLEEMTEMGYKMNLWEHAFTHPASPIYKALLPYAGDYEVWGGLVPDFATKEARGIFGKYHKETLIDKGFSGFKLDECDGSDLTGGWTYPNMAQFPSGLNGEQMHSILPQLYQQTMIEQFREKGIRTLGEVRAQFSYAAPYPFVLYSDLYGHDDFIRALINMGFTGLLFSPEIREAASKDDLYRRILSGVFSIKLEFNIFYMKNPPWFNHVIKENNNGVADKDVSEITDKCRELLNIKMKLVPYLYTAFHRYYTDGIHPFRSLRSIYPEIAAQETVEGCALGNDIIVYPLTVAQNKVKIYLPKGQWYEFFTNELFEGGKQYELEYASNRIPVFVKAGTILPMLENTMLDLNKDMMEITPYIYPNKSGNAKCELYEDDGISYGYENGEYNIYKLTYKDGGLRIDKKGKYNGKKAVFSTYKVVK